MTRKTSSHKRLHQTVSPVEGTVKAAKANAKKTIPGTIEGVIESLGDDHRSPATLKIYRHVLVRFQAFLEDHEVPSDQPSQITLDLVRKFYQALNRAGIRRGKGDAKPPATGLSIASQKLFRIAVKVYMLHLVGEGVVHFEPEDFLRLNNLAKLKSTATQKLVQPIDDEIYAEMIKVADEEIADAEEKYDARLKEHKDSKRLWSAVLRAYRNRAWLAALRTSGMRIAEASTLKREQLDHQEHLAQVTGKGKKQRIVVFSRSAFTAIETYFKKRGDGTLRISLGKLYVFSSHKRFEKPGLYPWSTTDMESVFNRIYRQARTKDENQRHFGLKAKPTPHTLRHRFATQVLDETGDLTVTQDMLGHESPTTTRRYAQVSARKIKEAHKIAFEDDD